MRSWRLSIGVAAFGLIVGATPFAFAQNAKEKVLHNFNTNKQDGIGPSGGLIFDAAGNLYGETLRSHNAGFGAVFELTPSDNGFWTEAILHDFSYSDGVDPSGTLIFDTSGNLYGTTIAGGSGTGTGCSVRVGGCGTVFELSPVAGGGWTETVLYNFDHTNGANPRGGLVFDAGGNLYGTTYVGGGSYSSTVGTVFELSPTAGGGWTKTVLHNFRDNHVDKDGVEPNGDLIFDAAGNLYGTTVGGGSDGFGTVFELSPQADGSWKETVLYSFSAGGGGIQPNSGLVFDAVGNLYGTTQLGGTHESSTVFELSPALGGGWTESVLYTFSNPNDGPAAEGSLVFDAAGNLYGALSGSVGCNTDCGQIFKLSNSAGVWSETALFSFDSKNGAQPNGGLIFDAAGNLYGTTTAGGTKGAGTAFEIALQIY